MIETYQGSVQRWECDANDHQNLRYYVYKTHQGIVIGLRKLGIADHPAAIEALQHLRTHHIRFLREARATTPVVIECGVLEFRSGDFVDLLLVTRNSSSREVSATFVTRVGLESIEHQPFDGPLETLLEEAKPRGIAAKPSAYVGMDIATALSHGFHKVGAGVIDQSECDEHGFLRPYHYQSRLADGMPGLRALTHTNEEMQARVRGTTGGAMLEYRMQFHRRLRVNTEFTHLAGIHTVGNKTQGMTHLLYDADSGVLAVSAEGLNVSIDLATRRSTNIPDQRRRRIEEIKLRPRS